MIVEFKNIQADSDGHAVVKIASYLKGKGVNLEGWHHDRDVPVSVHVFVRPREWG